MTATYRAWKQGAAFANPCFTQIHPTAIPPSEAYQAKLTLMSESLRNDGRLWVPKQKGDIRSPEQTSAERDGWNGAIHALAISRPAIWPHGQ